MRDYTWNTVKGLLFFAFLLMATVAKGQHKPEILENKVTSPDGHLVVTLFQRENGSGAKTLFYQVDYKSKPVILESALALKLDNHLSQLALALKPDKDIDWFNDLKFKGSLSTYQDTVWFPLYGERSQIRDHYHERVLQFEKSDDARYKVDLVVRVYNEGVALRYYFHENPTGVYYRIVSEDTEFTFPENTQAWYEQWAQGPFKLSTLTNWPDECERPLTLN